MIVSPSRLRNVHRIWIGEHCAIFEGAWLQAETGGCTLEIGDHCYLGSRVHVHSASSIRIGSNCMLTDDVVISDGRHEPDDLARVVSRGPISIGDRVFLGVKAVVLGGVTIGDGATVGAGSVVTRDVPPGAVVAGVPARQIGTSRAPASSR